MNNDTAPPTVPAGILLPFPARPSFKQLLDQSQLRGKLRTVPDPEPPMRPTWLTVLVAGMGGFAIGALLMLVVIVA